MAIYNMHDAKTHFSKLIRRVSAGEEIVIARAGRPVARVVPIEDEGARRALGAYEGEVSWSGDFDAPLDEVAGDFEGDA